MTNEFLMSLLVMIPKWIKKGEIVNDEAVIYAHREYIVPLMTFLKYHTNTQYKLMIDICGVDYPSRENRFEVVYNLLSLRYASRLRVIIETDELTPVDSVTSLYSNTNWIEREAYDMFGIIFKNHPDLRRILSDYGFQGYPLRKDFPLTGYVEIRYDDEQRRIVTEPVKLSQEYR